MKFQGPGQNIVDWMTAYPQNSYLTPNVTVFEGKVFKRWLGHGGGTCMIVVSVHVK